MTIAELQAENAKLKAQLAAKNAPIARNTSSTAPSIPIKFYGRICPHCGSFYHV